MSVTLDGALSVGRHQGFTFPRRYYMVLAIQASWFLAVEAVGAVRPEEVQRAWPPWRVVFGTFDSSRAAAEEFIESMIK